MKLRTLIIVFALLTSLLVAAEPPSSTTQPNSNTNSTNTKNVDWDPDYNAKPDFSKPWVLAGTIVTGVCSLLHWVIHILSVTRNKKKKNSWVRIAVLKCVNRGVSGAWGAAAVAYSAYGIQTAKHIYACGNCTKAYDLHSHIGPITLYGGAFFYFISAAFVTPICRYIMMKWDHVAKKKAEKFLAKCLKIPITAGISMFMLPEVAATSVVPPGTDCFHSPDIAKKVSLVEWATPTASLAAIMVVVLGVYALCKLSGAKEENNHAVRGGCALLVAAGLCFFSFCLCAGAFCVYVFHIYRHVPVEVENGFASVLVPVWVGFMEAIVDLAGLCCDDTQSPDAVDHYPHEQGDGGDNNYPQHQYSLYEDQQQQQAAYPSMPPPPPMQGQRPYGYNPSYAASEASSMATYQEGVQ